MSSPSAQGLSYVHSAVYSPHPSGTSVDPVFLILKAPARRAQGLLPSFGRERVETVWFVAYAGHVSAEGGDCIQPLIKSLPALPEGNRVVIVDSQNHFAEHLGRGSDEV